MISSLKLVILLGIIQVVAGCAAPYFNTPAWKAVERRLKVIEEKCKYNIAAVVGTTKFVGNTACKYPPAQMYCVKKCLKSISNRPGVTVKKVQCTDFVKLNDGSKPSDLGMTCKCFYPAKTGAPSKPIETSAFTLDEVGKAFEEFSVSNKCEDNSGLPGVIMITQPAVPTPQPTMPATGVSESISTSRTTGVTLSTTTATTGVSGSISTSQTTAETTANLTISSTITTPATTTSPLTCDAYKVYKNQYPSCSNMMYNIDTSPIRNQDTCCATCARFSAEACFYNGTTCGQCFDFRGIRRLPGSVAFVRKREGHRKLRNESEKLK